MATFDRNCLKEFIRDVENDIAEFIGSEFCGARLLGNIASQHAQGQISDEEARQLINDAQHLMRLAKLGHKYAKLARKPSPEMETMVLSAIKQEGSFT